jgi:hypothetical protein
MFGATGPLPSPVFPLAAFCREGQDGTSAPTSIPA